MILVQTRHYWNVTFITMTIVFCIFYRLLSTLHYLFISRSFFFTFIRCVCVCVNANVVLNVKNCSHLPSHPLLYFTLFFYFLFFPVGTQRRPKSHLCSKPFYRKHFRLYSRTITNGKCVNYRVYTKLK